MIKGLIIGVSGLIVFNILSYIGSPYFLCLILCALSGAFTGNLYGEKS